VTALFAGPRGSGRIMAVEALARELRRDLYYVDLSSLVSKYIGETQRNLRHVFDAAEASDAVLFFDDADGLFGKRSEVKDSHDHYANIATNYLLKRMKAYCGLTIILTTDLDDAWKAALLRRQCFTVEFPLPDVATSAVYS
jgi:SpoVK/Ycf46/Vps4 family AAA+-type ATPase